ncbi:MAG: sulfurtransferase [Bradymonadaceae bacterium]
MTSRPARRPTRRLAIWLVATAAVLTAPSPVGASDESTSSGGPVGWVVSPDRAVELADRSQASVLDARSRSKWREEHVEGAAHVDWQQFTPDTPSRRGVLLDDDGTLEKRLRALGVSSGEPVLVVGAADDGWGRAGRIVWMLRTLGHEKAAWVDGGHGALVEAGLEVSKNEPEVETGDFTVERRDDWTIDRSRLRQIYDREDVLLIDTRQRREYLGATPYGESRGGHIPGAAHLHFEELLGPDGRLLDESAIQEKLADIGATEDTRIVTYCTGGVRSAWVASVLVELGYDRVRNYAGSTWEWSAGDPERFPLETGPSGETGK